MYIYTYLYIYIDIYIYIYRYLYVYVYIYNITTDSHDSWIQKAVAARRFGGGRPALLSRLRSAHSGWVDDGEVQRSSDKKRGECGHK